MNNKVKKRNSNSVVSKSRASTKNKFNHSNLTISKKLMLALSISLLILSLVQSFTMITMSGKATSAGIGSINITSPITDELQACNISLTTDYGRWNYFSSPIYLKSNIVRQALGNVDGFYDWVFEYDHSDGFFDYYFYQFDFGTMSGMSVGNCYILKATDNTSLVFNGTAEYTNISKGFTTNFGRWNYVGWVNQSTNITNALNSIDGDYDWVFRYDSTTGLFEYYFALFDSGPLRDIDPCECYIVKAKDNVTLNYVKN